ncbi:hypothetical protein E3N88_22836 [Mikania micrantha]|uniref:EGF-like domain-containing protein n=1 Tax=Mikania micrantha TaxID=192012 RepID=A0A5N6NE90_9ASTR|nr:hypothetical protein E3N88_22836 [Mikania micrantha]
MVLKALSRTCNNELVNECVWKNPDACKDKDCGQGKCVADQPVPELLFHCECDVGWKTIMVGPMPFGSCIIPNCTIDFSCGGKYPPTPPLPPINFTSRYLDGDCDHLRLLPSSPPPPSSVASPGGK